MVILILTFNSWGFDGLLEDGWKNIKPLRTNMTMAEKILGSPKASKDSYYNYETSDFFIQINYSTASCKESNYEKGNYDIPLDTVISYRVVLTKDIKLKDLKFQREKYERQISPEQNKLIYYINRNDAIMIKVSIVDDVEYVGQIIFDPSPADKKKFECKKPEAATEKPQESKTVEKRKCGKPK